MFLMISHILGHPISEFLASKSEFGGYYWLYYGLNWKVMCHRKSFIYMLDTLESVSCMFLMIFDNLGHFWRNKRNFRTLSNYSYRIVEWKVYLIDERICKNPLVYGLRAFRCIYRPKMPLVCHFGHKCDLKYGFISFFD